jgi:multicomponent Na+:H+ antiporter subunit E
MIARALTLAAWAFAVWFLLTWTATVEQLIFGGALALTVGIAMAPLGEVVKPWRLLDPRRLLAVIQLLVAASVRVVRANLSLAHRIWAPSRPLSSGMVIVATELDTDAGLAATGLLTSLIVDNQIVDIDRTRHLLQYHAVAVPEGSRQARAGSINAPIEVLVARIDRRRR